MKRVIVVLALVCLVAVGTAAVGDDNFGDGNLKGGADVSGAASTNVVEHADVLSVLRGGKDAGMLPRNVLVRIRADLSMAVPADPKERREAELRGTDFSKTLNEVWEFSSDRVHKLAVVPSKQKDRIAYRRTMTLPINTNSICKDLLAGKIDKIEEGEGVGEPVLFAGTDFAYGDRSIQVFVDGRLELEVGECCVAPGMAESDAHAFATLYEQLAKPARTAFGPKSR